MKWNVGTFEDPTTGSAQPDEYKSYISSPINNHKES